MFYELTFILDTLAHWTQACKPELSADMLLNIMGTFKKVSPRSREDCRVPGPRRVGGGARESFALSPWWSQPFCRDLQFQEAVPKPGGGCKTA